MVVNFISYDYAEDDYIDMEVSTFSAFLCNSITSPSHPREFEFQMSSGPLERDTTTSPADELFYKGKLLPLHLPPRLQMVEKLLQNSNSAFEEFYSTPLATTRAPTPTASTPFESCNVSPSESCHVSCELNPEEYFLQYSTELSGFIGESSKKSWTRKLNVMKKSSLGSKLKASRAYLKSFFGKSSCSDESRAADAKNVKAPKKNTFQRSTTAMRSFDNGKMITEDGGRHRRSFSLSIRRHSTNKSSPSSSSSDSSSSSVHELKNMKRSSSTKSEMESPIQGAIAHCKQSHQKFHSRKTMSEVGFYSLSAARISACDDQERSEVEGEILRQSTK